MLYSINQYNKLHIMGKKNDTELMHEFNLNYSYLNFQDFSMKVDENKNGNKIEKLFYKIIWDNELNRTGLDTLRSMNHVLKSFKPKNENLKLELITISINIESAFSKAKNDHYES